MSYVTGNYIYGIHRNTFIASKALHHLPQLAKRNRLTPSPPTSLHSLKLRRLQRLQHHDICQDRRFLPGGGHRRRYAEDHVGFLIAESAHDGFSVRHHVSYASAAECVVAASETIFIFFRRILSARSLQEKREGRTKCHTCYRRDSLYSASKPSDCLDRSRPPF